MKYIKIKGFEEYPATVYFDRGRFFIDYHDATKPIHSYETLQAVKEALYYHYN